VLVIEADQSYLMFVVDAGHHLKRKLC